MRFSFGERGRIASASRYLPREEDAFNGSVRRDCLSQHWFASLGEAAIELERRRGEYNNEGPIAV